VANFKITVQYDGTEYHGWQIQSGLRTIQGELTRVLSLLDHGPVTVHGAGRTDAGVHAEAQVLSARLSREFDPILLREAMNGNLDRDIRVADCVVAEDAFHARLHARAKTYRYRIWTAAVESPFAYKYSYHYRGELNVAAMREAALALIGRHDFSAFTIKESEAEDRVRTLFRLDIEQVADELLIAAEGEGFLRFMVRTIAGTLLEIGKGRIPAPEMLSILNSGERERAGPTAPAHGLTLVRVDY
jgi:tRNA pseudouridine38-40 synthase